MSKRKGTLCVLAIEQDPAQCELIRDRLHAPGRETVEVTFAHSVKEASAIIGERKFNCILVAHQLPDGGGLDFLEKHDEELLTTPVIGLITVADSAVAVGYFRAGCIDVFIKEEVLSGDTLRRRIAAAMARFHSRAMATIIERRQLGDAVVKSQEGLIELARTDRLMGICNRGVFDDYYESYHADAVGRGGTYVLCMIDVDHFKAYNDGYGHPAGDEALRQVARLLTSSLREKDFIARYGGEELVALLDEGPPESVESVADRLRRLVFERGIPHKGSRHGCVTVSIGVAMFSPESGGTTTSVLARADEALYRAKASGRNTFVVAACGQERRIA